MPQTPVRPRQAVAPPRPVARATARAEASWDDAVLAFLNTKRSENVSPSTISNYDWFLRGSRAQTFCADHGITSARELTAEALEMLQREVLEAGVSAAMAHAFHRVWKNFAGFCVRRGYGSEAAVLMVKAPKLPMAEPAAFTEDEERRLLAAAAPGRDRMIVELLLRTGVRLAEVVGLTLDDVIDGPEGSYLRVRQGKGGKDRIIPLDTGHVQLSTKLRKYIRQNRGQESDSRALFLTTRKNAGEYVPLDRRGVQIFIRRLGERARVHAHPHKFRHTFATRALAAGVDVMALQRVLGHTTLTMVSRYVHYQKGDLIDAWKRRTD